MNKDEKRERDIKLFSDIANRLVYFTTKDEYGSIRSRGIEAYSHLAEELNNEGILTQSKKTWTENSVKLFLSRIMKRYPDHNFYEDCDFDLIGRSCWEYQSQTTYQELCKERHWKSSLSKTEYNSSSKVYTYNDNEIEKWKEHEIEDIIWEERKIISEAKKSLKRTRLSKS